MRKKKKRDMLPALKARRYYKRLDDIPMKDSEYKKLTAKYIIGGMMNIVNTELLIGQLADLINPQVHSVAEGYADSRVPEADTVEDSKKISQKIISYLNRYYIIEEREW